MNQVVETTAEWSFPLCPEPGGAAIDWTALEACFPALGDMGACGQEPEYHAEGDVLTHTKWVCGELIAMEPWRTLSREQRSVLFLAALLHDVGKPMCTRNEDGRISTPGHARKGSQLARRMMYQPNRAAEALGFPVPFEVRERIVALIRHHGLPLSFLMKDSPQRATIAASESARCDHLAILAEADARGRSCAAQQELLDRVEMFREFAIEVGCASGPYAFASDHARAVYFENPDALPTYAAYDDTVCEVVLMSGLPGAGKDHWRAANLPGMAVISLDALRKEMGVDPADKQGKVVARAASDARVHLRADRSFVWNATNTTRAMRRQLIELFRAYRARVRIVYVETPYRQLIARNRARSAAVPERVIDRLLSRLEIPDRTEAHCVEWVHSGSQGDGRK